MAGEKKGKAYEAFTKATLDSLTKRGIIRENIFWDSKPKLMTIVPDFIIGSTVEEPQINLLISHGGSVKESNRKYWRNCGELIECKLFLDTVPRVFSLFFDSKIKEDIKKAGQSTFDGEVFVGDLKYGPDLQQWIDDNLTRFPKEKNEKVDFLVNEAKTDKKLKGLLVSFEKDLEVLLKQKAPIELEQVWNLERKRSPGKAPRARDTSIRRGLSKLFVFPDLDVLLRLFSGKHVKIDDVPGYAFDLGLATKFSSGNQGIAKPADKEVANLLATLGVEVVRELFKLAPKLTTAGFWEQVEKVRNAALLSSYVEFIDRNYASLCSVDGMKSALLSLHKNPSEGLRAPKLTDPPANVWLFDVIGALVKTSAKRSQEFGYSIFAKHRDSKSSQIGNMWVGDWCSCFFNQFVSRKATFTAPDIAVKHVATVLAAELSKISHDSIATLGAKALEKYLAKEYNATLLSHRGIDPILGCVLAGGIAGRKEAIRSCFGEKASLSGQATQTTVLRNGKTLINWQSASDAGRDHKKKELCGRAVALRYSWDAKHKRFIPRPGVEKLILVVDGTWRREDLLALARAGWDEIFYPDEMDKLAAAVV